MTLKEFLFEFEELELKTKIINATFSFCYENLMEQANKEAELVLTSLFDQIYLLADQMGELMKKGWSGIQEGTV
ncbi:MAG: hypothetical protein K1V96_04115 [Lachnospiraceae bacterium]